MDIAAVKATISRGNQAAKDAQRTIEAAFDQADAARTLATQTTQGSRHPDVEQGLAALKEAAHEAELVLRRLAECLDHAERYVDALG